MATFLFGVIVGWIFAVATERTKEQEDADKMNKAGKVISDAFRSDT